MAKLSVLKVNNQLSPRALFVWKSISVRLKTKINLFSMSLSTAQLRPLYEWDVQCFRFGELEAKKVSLSTSINKSLNCVWRLTLPAHTRRDGPVPTEIKSHLRNDAAFKKAGRNLNRGVYGCLCAGERRRNPSRRSWTQHDSKKGLSF